MPLSDFFKSFFSSLSNAAIDSAANAGKRNANAIRRMEQQIRMFERNNPNMTAEQREMIAQKKQRLQEMKTKMQENGYDEKGNLGGKSIDEWDRLWKCIGPLKSANLTPYNHSVGLYKHVIGNEIVYIGRAIEYNNGGLRKRLSDYRRENDSAREHQSGQSINSHLDEITTYVLVVGDDEKAAEMTKKLEIMFIAKYKPRFNRNFK
jgi:hypothetical protein